jgi:hypothetical protein
MYGCGGGNYTPPPTYIAPTCAISVSNANIHAGETVNVGWSSTNAFSGSISNLGSYLPTSGSRAVTLNNTTTFYGTFTGNGGTATCSKTVTVTAVPAPTCSITGPDTATAGQSITLNWSSTHSTRGDISNLGTNLSASGSHSFAIGNTTTFYGTFYGENGQTANCSKTVTVTVPQCPAGYTGTYPNCYPPVQYCPAGYTGTYPNCYPPVQYCPAGYTGTYPNCYPPQNNNLSCTITVNNYGNNYNNNYFAPNTAITLSWNSNGASYGNINQGLGSVGATGSRTIYPSQTTTYTGTFYNNNGQQVTCSATVYVNGYVPPTNNTPYVTLSAVPYTGLELGPVGTVLYWGFIAFWCALAAYLIVIKKVQNNVYASLRGILFGSGASHIVHTPATTHVSHVSYAAPAEVDTTDSFIVSQINRVRN